MILNQVKTEQVVVASVLTEENLRLPIGAGICMALAYWPYWDCVEASMLAQGINKVIQRGFLPSRAMVKAMTEPPYREWLDHATFKDGVPIRLADHEARDLLPLYRNKRTIELVGRHYQQMIDQPEKAHELAVKLKEELEGL